MNKYIVKIFIYLIILQINVYSQNNFWAESMGGTLSDAGFSNLLDANGNLYVTGNFEGISDFDPSSGIKNLTSIGGVDIFFAKYNQYGNLIW